MRRSGSQRTRALFPLSVGESGLLPFFPSGDADGGIIPSGFDPFPDSSPPFPFPSFFPPPPRRKRTTRRRIGRETRGEGGAGDGTSGEDRGREAATGILDRIRRAEAMASRGVGASPAGRERDRTISPLRAAIRSSMRDCSPEGAAPRVHCDQTFSRRSS